MNAQELAAELRMNAIDAEDDHETMLHWPNWPQAMRRAADMLDPPSGNAASRSFRRLPEQWQAAAAEGLAALHEREPNDGTHLDFRVRADGALLGYLDTPEVREQRRRLAERDTVGVRIYVEVGADGDWYAGGGSGWSDADAISLVSECMEPSRGSWVTARVPKPEPPAEVEGKVES